jgi:uncharacterized membrane protein
MLNTGHIHSNEHERYSYELKIFSLVWKALYTLISHTFIHQYFFIMIYTMKDVKTSYKRVENLGYKREDNLVLVAW